MTKLQNASMHFPPSCIHIRTSTSERSSLHTAPPWLKNCYLFCLSAFHSSLMFSFLCPSIHNTSMFSRIMNPLAHYMLLEDYNLSPSPPLVLLSTHSCSDSMAKSSSYSTALYSQGATEAMPPTFGDFIF